MGIVNRPGAFAEFVALPTVNLHEVPEIPDQSAVFTEPLAAAAEILEQLPLTLSTRVAVLGSGRLGLLIAQVLRHAGAEVTVIGRNAAKIELARSWGFTCLRAGASSEGNEVPPKSFAVVVEAQISAEALGAEFVFPRRADAQARLGRRLNRLDLKLRWKICI